MQNIGLWSIGENGPSKLSDSQIKIEEQLEDWIENEPALLLNGLTIVGRQVSVEGGMIDLLGLDRQGRWIVIEIKRGKLRRKVVAQALDYAASIDLMSYQDLVHKVSDYIEVNKSEDPQRFLEELGASEEAEDESREINVYLVGVGTDQGLERIVNYLSEKYQIPLIVSSFQVYETHSGANILVRELLESENEIEKKTRTYKRSVDEIVGTASQFGLAEGFNKLIEMGKKYGLYPRPYKRSVMLTPPSNKSRTILNIKHPKSKQDALKLYIATSAISEFFPISIEEVEKIIGEERDEHFTNEGILNFADKFEEVFQKIKEIQEGASAE